MWVRECESLSFFLPACLCVCLFVRGVGMGGRVGVGGRQSVRLAGCLSVCLSVCVFLIVPFYVWSACLVCVCVCLCLCLCLLMRVFVGGARGDGGWERSV